MEHPLAAELNVVTQMSWRGLGSRSRASISSKLCGRPRGLQLVSGPSGGKRLAGNLPNVIPNVPLGASRRPVLRSRQLARATAKTPWGRSRGRGGLPKLGVAGSNPVRRSRFSSGRVPSKDLRR
jgi:hypothetical protein